MLKVLLLNTAQARVEDVGSAFLTPTLSKPFYISTLGKPVLTLLGAFLTPTLSKLVLGVDKTERCN